MIGYWEQDFDHKIIALPGPPVLPEPWAAAPRKDAHFPARVFDGDGDESSWLRAQLALCMFGPTVTSTKPVGKCRYEFGGIIDRNLADATYTFRVFEARTGRLIKEFDLPGTVDDCPGSIDAQESGPIARSLDARSVIGQLRPLVEDPAS